MYLLGGKVCRFKQARLSLSPSLPQTQKQQKERESIIRTLEWCVCAYECWRCIAGVLHTICVVFHDQTYVGDYKQRLRDGHGTYTFPRGYFKYAGQWRRGEMHGQGVFSMGDGSLYEGEFRNGEIEGIGLRRWPSGDSYSGQFRQGEMHGEGVFLSSSTGERYEGQWQSNQRVGHGELVYGNENVYNGEFANHKQHGRGKMVFADSMDSYNGEWRSGAMCGRGVLCDGDGNTLYDGEWRDGNRQGTGAGFTDVMNLSEPDELAAKGRIWYDGSWQDNEPTGTFGSSVWFYLHNDHDVQ